MSLSTLSGAQLLTLLHIQPLDQHPELLQQIQIPTM